MIGREDLSVRTRSVAFRDPGGRRRPGSRPQRISRADGLSEETILSDPQFLNELRTTEARTAPRFVGAPLAADRLSMSQMTTRHWNFEEDILGYRRFELSRVAVWHQKLALFGEEKALDLLAEHPVAVTSLYHGGGFLDADELRWGDPAADAIEGVRLAARLGARDVVVVSGDRGTFTKGHAKRLLVESLRRLADAAGESGVHVALAPLHRSQSRGRTFLTELEETIEVIDRTRHARLGWRWTCWPRGTMPAS